MTSTKVLLVDDEDLILEVFRMDLEGEFEIDIAEGADQAWKLINAGNKYGAIVSDMHMPSVSGSVFLNSVHNKFPLITRMMMTADEDQETAAKAVNEGQIFRFLRKPCKSADLAVALKDGLELHRLVSAEKELLENTLKGSITLLMDMLSSVKPLAFGRSSRVKRLVEQLCERSAPPNAWDVKLAAMLSQIGCVSLPDNILEAVHKGEKLTAVDQMEFNKHPALGELLLKKIPRLERISRIVGNQLRPFDDLSRTLKTQQEQDHAAMIAVCLEFDRLATATKSPSAAINELRRLPKQFSQSVVDAIDEMVRGKTTSKVVTIDGLRVGMVLEGDLTDDRGTLLVASGQEISEVMLERLRRRANNISRSITVSEVEMEPSAGV